MQYRLGRETVYSTVLHVDVSSNGHGGSSSSNVASIEKSSSEARSPIVLATFVAYSCEPRLPHMSAALSTQYSTVAARVLYVLIMPGRTPATASATDRKLQVQRLSARALNLLPKDASALPQHLVLRCLSHRPHKVLHNKHKQADSTRDTAP